MSDLLSSLRSLLPQEYVRGQSSTCDDLEEAVKYIKNLETSIKELKEKRDMLKKSLSSPQNDQHVDDIGSSSSSSNNSTTNRAVNDDYVTIHTFPRRLEIEISVKVEGEDAFRLSKLLKQVSLEQGLEVVHCVSSKIEETWKCIIHCDKVNDQQTSDYSELQKRLANEISTYAN